MEWKREWKTLCAILFVFLGCYYLPVGKYLSSKSKKLLGFGIALMGGTIPAAYSCSVLPLIYISMFACSAEGKNAT